MSYPSKVKLFKPWAQAMVDGATVGNPDYGKRNSTTTVKVAATTRRRKRRRRKKKRTQDA